LSPEGKRLAYQSSATASGDFVDIWIHDFERGTSEPLTSGGSNVYPVWSFDGHSLLYASNVGGSFDIHQLAVDGTQAAEILYDGENSVLPSSLSKDGTLMFWEVNPATSRDIWTFADGDAEPILQTRFNERSPTISPDGKWFAYISNEDGSDEILVRQLPDSGLKWTISDAGGTEPLWSPSGDEIFYRVGSAFMAVSVGTSSGFTHDPPVQLFEGNFAFEGFGAANYDVTRDGQRFVAVLETGRSLQVVRVIFNGLADVERLVPRGQ